MSLRCSHMHIQRLNVDEDSDRKVDHQSQHGWLKQYLCVGNKYQRIMCRNIASCMVSRDGCYSQEKKSEKLTSTGILWRKGFDTWIRGNLVCWIRKRMLASWEMTSWWSNLHIFKMAAKNHGIWHITDFFDFFDNNHLFYVLRSFYH